MDTQLRMYSCLLADGVFTTQVLRRKTTRKEGAIPLSLSHQQRMNQIRGAGDGTEQFRSQKSYTAPRLPQWLPSGPQVRSGVNTSQHDAFVP